MHSPALRAESALPLVPDMRDMDWEFNSAEKNLG